VKPPRPTVVEKIQAKQAQPVLNPVDVQNVVFAARRALSQLAGTDLLNVSVSIANIEQAYAPKAPAKSSEQANGG
jgi:hypothetical protein